jgi:hypothetical protein
MEQIQAKSQSPKNRMIRFWILEGPVFSEQIESDLGVIFRLFRNDLPVYESKSYVMLPI